MPVDFNGRAVDIKNISELANQVQFIADRRCSTWFGLLLW